MILIKAISVLGHSKPLEFVIVKDIFSYIDTRGDGYIDMHEWMEAFRRIEIPIDPDVIYQQHIILSSAI